MPKCAQQANRYCAMPVLPRARPRRNPIRMSNFTHTRKCGAPKDRGVTSRNAPNYHDEFFFPYVRKHANAAWPCRMPLQLSMRYTQAALDMADWPLPLPMTPHGPHDGLPSHFASHTPKCLRDCPPRHSPAASKSASARVEEYCPSALIGPHL